MITSGWIFDNNLRPFLQFLGWTVDYDWAPSEFIAIEMGIEPQDSGTCPWYEYPIYGKEKAILRVSRDEAGSSVLNVEVNSSPEIAVKCEVAIELMCSFRLQ